MELTDFSVRLITSNGEQVSIMAAQATLHTMRPLQRFIPEDLQRAVVVFFEYSQGQRYWYWPEWAERVRYNVSDNGELC